MSVDGNEEANVADDDTFGERTSFYLSSVVWPYKPPLDYTGTAAPN
jgi:hypothetical protein